MGFVEKSLDESNFELCDSPSLVTHIANYNLNLR